MYTIDETKLDKLLTEADNVSRLMVFNGGHVPVQDRNQFGRALLAVQTEIVNLKADRNKNQLTMQAVSNT